MKTLTLTPAKLNFTPSLDKYYGVYPMSQLHESRMMIVAACGSFPKPKRFKVIPFYLNIKGNSYDSIEKINDEEEHCKTIEALIIRLTEKGWGVAEFETHRDLANWLADMSPDHVPFRNGDKVKTKYGTEIMTIEVVYPMRHGSKEFPAFEYSVKNGWERHAHSNLRLVQRVETKKKNISENEEQSS